MVPAASGSTKVQTALKHDPTGHFPRAGLVPKKVTPYIYANAFTITSCARIVETPFQGIPYPIAGQTQMRFKRFCIPFYHQDITPEWLVYDVFLSFSTISRPIVSFPGRGNPT
jgi:hypothetical protein